MPGDGDGGGGGGGWDSPAVKCCVGFWASLLTLGFCVLSYWWSVSETHQILATVDSANLSRLTVSNASAAVSYRLAVSLNLYNPITNISIYYDSISAELRFRDAVIGPAANDTSPSELYQEGKTGKEVTLVFDYGRGEGVTVSSGVAAELEKEMESAVSLELDVRARVRYVLELRTYKLRQKLTIRCWMSIPVKAEGRGALVSGDRCRVKY